MKNIEIFKLLRACVVVLLIANFGAACKAGSELSGNFDFGFDLFYDGQHAAILDYKLWNEKGVMAQSPKYSGPQDRKFYRDAVDGPNVKPAYLYVKWLDENASKVYEVTIDLRNKLPNNTDGSEMYVMIYGETIYVYVALKDFLPKGEKSIGASRYADRINLQIYPAINK